MAKSLSPLTYASNRGVPVLIVHGDADDVVPYQQSTALLAALKQAGSKAELITLPGGRHGFPEQQGQVVWPQVFRWLKKIKVL